MEGEEGKEEEEGKGQERLHILGLLPKAGCNTEPRTFSLLKLSPILPIPKMVEVGEKKSFGWKNAD